MPARLAMNSTLSDPSPVQRTLHNNERPCTVPTAADLYSFAVHSDHLDSVSVSSFRFVPPTYSKSSAGCYVERSIFRRLLCKTFRTLHTANYGFVVVREQLEREHLVVRWI